MKNILAVISLVVGTIIFGWAGRTILDYRECLTDSLPFSEITMIVIVIIGAFLMLLSGILAGLTNEPKKE